MELRQMRYFVAVAEELNISRAARRLNISQPPLTRQIHLLEEQVGMPLLRREVRGVELTDAGRMLLTDARRILESVAKARDRARSAGMGQIGRLDMAVFGSVMLDTVPVLLAQFRKSNPYVEVVLHTLNKGEQVEALRQQRIAVGFSRLSSSLTDIAQLRVKKERLMVAFPTAHPLARRRSVSLAALADEPLVLFASGSRPNFIDVVFALFHREGLQPVVSQTVEDAITGVSLVAAGFGACLVPSAVTHLRLPGVSFVALGDAGANAGAADLYCTYRRDDDSPVTLAFLNLIKRSVRG